MGLSVECWTLSVAPTVDELRGSVSAGPRDRVYCALTVALTVAPGFAGTPGKDGSAGPPGLRGAVGMTGAAGKDGAAGKVWLTLS